MPRPRVYKLEHLAAVEAGQDSNLYFKTTWSDEDLTMLIKVWMYKIADYVPEYEFYEEEMMELLETFGHKQIPADSPFKTYYSADMYEIWEAANIRPTEDDKSNPRFYNDNANKVFEKVLKRNDDEFLEHALKNDNYKKYNEYARRDFDKVAMRNGITV
ncbi:MULTISPECIES: hypothetical protein [unclassified Paenibacillus]|uniref:hypothetical protein n=1 Tax=unclassified Paenibacillus TaxID=185978 RepID=UPI00034E1B08|nr:MULTISPECIES: hypothetical protein [unclassified Paenibacillus]EPD81363.1 hypothetical protein HMPREF1207_05121 [Paenibacillus sp. HGH0039]